MENYRYLIVGGGMAADAAVDGIRTLDAEGSVGLFSAEPDPPYSRPPLSKGLWNGDDAESVWRHTEGKDVALHTGHRIQSVDLDARQAIDDQGARYGFDSLLLATGGTPRRLPFGDDEIIYYRTLGDYRRLREVAALGERFAVIGGGFIGSEIAAALAMNGKRVTEVFPDAGIGAAAYPADLSSFLNDYYSRHGVEIIASDAAVGLERRDGELTLLTAGGQVLAVDGVVAGIGIEPNVALAQSMGLAVDNGILVDEFLRTSAPAVFAAGDVAAFQSVELGARVRVEHEDNALSMGRHAGINMARSLTRLAGEPYRHLPFFYSDLFELGYEAVGQLDARLETFSDWTDPYQQGVVYYLLGERVRGVLLWNVWGKVGEARELIASPGPFSAAELRGRITP